MAKPVRCRASRRRRRIATPSPHTARQEQGAGRSRAGGGGGGYSGGGGGNAGGGGGGSYLALGAIDMTLLSGVRVGNGLVTIDYITPIPPTTVPEPASLAMLGLGLAGLVAMRQRARG